MNQRKPAIANNEHTRLVIVGWFLCLTAVVILGRLFYVQIIKHSDYENLAKAEQTKKFSIPPKRGEILAKEGESTVPLVLNEPAYTIFADPRYVESPKKTAKKLASVLKVNPSKLEKLLKADNAYVNLARQVGASVEKKVLALRLKGIGSIEGSRRVYPEGTLASQTLGFVNADGNGQYGLEQALNSQISGEPGQLNGATDIRGIPIATEDSIIQQPKDGDDIILTIDRTVQTQAEFFLAKGVKDSRARAGSILVMNPNSGRILAMANYPTYNPTQYSSQRDPEIFKNRVVSGAYEPGSVVKAFSMSTALDRGAVTPSTTYTDLGFRKIDGYRVGNATSEGVQTRTMTNVITNSVNTGTIFALEQLGGGSINNKAKKSLHTYFTDKFNFGRVTGVEQSGESSGFVLNPTNAPDISYANMSFGQGVSMTMMQLASAGSALVNGGDYYQPTLIDSIRQADGEIKENKPKLIKQSIVKNKTSKQIKDMMETVVKEGSARQAYREGYGVFGKTGTAEVAHPDGGYYKDREIGSFMGFGPKKNPEYVIIVRMDVPKKAGVFGSAAATPVFTKMSNWLIDYYGIPPRS